MKFPDAQNDGNDPATSKPTDNLEAGLVERHRRSALPSPSYVAVAGPAPSHSDPTRPTAAS
eukprot:1837796-Heterocapsa_arctica.AAC.1